jgi:hypothetical protein
VKEKSLEQRAEAYAVEHEAATLNIERLKAAYLAGADGATEEQAARIDWKGRHKHPQYEAFYEWFTDVLHQQGTCLLRDVIRDCQPQLWASWKMLEPVRVSEPKELK